ncbi:MAG: hypothetical protein K1X56_12245 [Flavobacteriales bacterium]|nr:hypothetical protein [Flavobacteriales bacterium]
MARIAVIDIGTNTINLLIAEGSKNNNSVLHSDRIPARLGKGGIGAKKITDDAFQRGIDALIQHHQTCVQFNCNSIYAFGTSMLRDAVNGKEFALEVHQHTGIQIEIIDGNREAELIWKGVREAGNVSGMYCIMDIGGGSTEFIIADHEKIHWKKSYQLGVTRLYEEIPHSDPIKEQEILATELHLKQELEDLFDALKSYDINTLIGSAGSFESYKTMIAHRCDEGPVDLKIPLHHIHMAEMEKLIEHILISHHEERCGMKGLHEIRRDLIVVASVLIRFVICNHSFSQVYFSVYALKEGVMAEQLSDK